MLKEGGEGDYGSKVGVEAPAEGFRDEKCSFLVLSRVLGTPITTKICRELKEALGTILGTPPTRFGAGGWSADQKRRPADHLAQIRGNLDFSHSFL